MKKVTKLPILACWICAVLLTAGCNRRPLQLQPVDYVGYMEAPEHNLRRKVISGNTIYTIQLATPEYVACRDAIGSDWNAARTRQRMAELQGTLFILIAIEPKAAGSVPLNNDQMALYYGGAVIRDLSLRYGDRDLRPAVCHFENNLGLVPQNTLVAGFRIGDRISRDIQLVFNDRYAGNPLINAGFEAETIHAIPTLQL